MTAAEYQRMKTKTRSKYGNKRVEYNGLMFASKHELDRYKFLLILEKCHEIKELKTQVKFDLIPKEPGFRAMSYVADFTYYERTAPVSWELVVEDAKSPATRKNRVYQIKKRLMRAKYGVLIRES